MQRTFKDEILYQWKHGGMHIRLIGINILVYLFINLTLTFGSLSVSRNAINPLEKLIDSIFCLQGSFWGVVTHPWGLFTSIFAHFSFWHLAFNLLFFYFIAQFFLSYFGNKRLLYTYILGGIAGGILQVIANSIFPGLEGNGTLIVGASGAVSAVFMAAAFYRPMAEVRLFGLIKTKMIYIAFAFILLDILQMGGGDNIAHFAHLGGIAFGIWSIHKIESPNNIIHIFERLIGNLKNSFQGKPKMKVYKNNPKKTENARYQTDDEYNLNKKKKQEEIDKILDKIAKSGYDSLSQKEKKILFDRSQE